MEALPRQSEGGDSRGPLRAAKRKADPVTPEVRAVVADRAGNRCERGCGAVGEHAHHRQLRRGGDHSAANLVWVCVWCHTGSPLAIHRNVSESLRTGWLVSQYDDPTTAPILLAGRWVLLGVDGSVTEAQDGAA